MKIRSCALVLLAACHHAPSPASDAGTGLGTVGPVRLSVGNGTACAVLGDGEVACWGSNLYGQLGLASGPDVETHLPSRVSGVSGAVSVGTRAFVSCALAQGGRVQCWGSNQHGALGNGSTTPSSTAQTVVDASGQPLVGIRSLGVGEEHACALDGTGAAWCWGANRWGQLGDGTTNDRTSATRVASPSGVQFSQVSAGLEHTCAVTGDGGAYCWGANNYGQLNHGADGGTPFLSAPAGLSPTLIPGLEPLQQLSAGDRHTCAVGSSGDVTCWGDNARSQAGAPVTSLIPPVPLAGVSSVSSGGRHTCALTVTGQVLCWGSNLDGQLGSKAPMVPGVPPTASPGLTSRAAADMGFSGAIEVAAGTSTTCIQLGDGGVQCWGDNKSGEAGNGLNRGSGMAPRTSRPAWRVDPASPVTVPL
jgi:alpha-tubulin suppressor-like RCC1 family protein